MNYTTSTIIVKAVDRLKAQEVTNDQYFNSEASTDGLAPATHYFMSGPFSNEEVDALVNTVWEKWVRSEDWVGALASINLLPVVPTEPIV
jgi:hypothetical protein